MAVKTIAETAVQKMSDGQFYRVCDRCRNASGYIPCFANVYGGVCFQCNGTGTYGAPLGADETAVEKKLVTNAKARARRQAKAAADADAKAAVFIAAKANQAAEWFAGDPARPELVRWMSAQTTGPAVSMLDSLTDYWNLTVKQEAFAHRLMAEAAEKAAKVAAGVTVPEGRVQVAGVVTWVNLEEAYVGYSTKMVCSVTVTTDAGWKVKFNAPSDVWDLVHDQGLRMEDLKGATICSTVTITRSQNDPLTGYGKRPAKTTVTMPKVTVNA